MSYDSALITGAQIVDHTGVQDLANLAADAELVLNTFALNAHRTIYRMLEGMGVDPTLLTNETRLYEAVAWEAVGRLALGGYISGDAAAFFAKRDEVFFGVNGKGGFRPDYATADEPRQAREAIPAVGHADGGMVFSGDMPDAAGLGYFSDDYPSAV